MARTEPTMASYDSRSADDVTRRLRMLSQADLAKLERYERQGQGRKTVLERIAALRGEAPWPGYDDMEVEQVNEALKKRDGDAARAVLDYERQHKARATIIEFAERTRPGGAGSAATASRRQGAGKAGSRARPSQRATSRSRSSKPNSAPKSSARKSTSTSSRRAPESKPASGSSRVKARASSRTGAKRASRPSARSSSKSRSSRPRSGARSPQTAPTRARRRMTRAARGAGARTEQTARRTGQVVGTAAERGRDAVGTAAHGTGQTVGAAANKAKGPVLTAGAVGVALGGGLLLGSKLVPQRTILGIPIPGRRSRFKQAAKSIRKARNGI